MFNFLLSYGPLVLFVFQMIQLVKEQLYHSSIVSSMFTVVPVCTSRFDSFALNHCTSCHEFTEHLNMVASVFDESMKRQVSMLERRVTERQSTSETIISNILQQVCAKIGNYCDTVVKLSVENMGVCVFSSP